MSPEGNSMKIRAKKKLEIDNPTRTLAEAKSLAKMGRKDRNMLYLKNSRKALKTISKYTMGYFIGSLLSKRVSWHSAVFRYTG